MTEKDFARVEAPGTPPAAGVGRAGMTAAVVAILLVVMASFAGGFWLGQERGRQAARSEDRARLEKQLAEQREELARLRKEASTRSEQTDGATSRVGELTFYNELPRQSVIPAPMSEPEASDEAPAAEGSAASPTAEDRTGAAAAPPEEEAAQMLENIIQRELKQRPTGAEEPRTGVAFRLQVGSFQKEGQAGPLMEKLRELGYRPSVESADVAELGRWHRVFVGPFDSRARAAEVKRELQRKLHVTGLVVRHGG